ncbi:hypothetical protein [Pseudoduganella lurida]|uniref:hypothetical protein n=1 Tax=Pseudoduganella lurida TaxID=1036180 RepID=UPI00119D6921|nr:hypothetical protein [Pseudoduganella lurida]
MNNDSSGPAFPTQTCSVFCLDASGEKVEVQRPGCDGMSLRDYFASKVLASLIVAPGLSFDNSMAPELARLSYVLADAMLFARNEGVENVQ